MPPKAKITKEMIVEVAFDIIQKEGLEKVTARSISKQLNCSTQPVLYYFATVEDIKKVVYQKADEYHSNYIMNMEHDYGNPMLAIGMNYINFAIEERNLPERFYHGFVLGLLVDLGKDYIVTSNRESGFGRYDVMLEPRDKSKDAFILEFEVRDPEEEKNLSETVEKALAQIEEKQYEADLTSRGISKERIRKYGFAFEGKKVLIGTF